MPRVVTSDPWAFLRNKSRLLLGKDDAERAYTYVDQAFDFFEAAANPRISSRPLLYYYSFLNLVKVLILQKRSIQLPLIARHGITDPGANVKQRLRFAGQLVRFKSPARKHSELFPELLLALEGEKRLSSGEHRVIHLLAQIPGIHRTCCSVLDEDPIFCPIEPIEFYSGRGKVWALLRARKSDKDVADTLGAIRRSHRFQRTFSHVTSKVKEELWFESIQVRGRGRGIDNAIGKLSRYIRRVGVYAIFTQRGYRYYLGKCPPRKLIPQLCSIYAVMFYLGSITRYKPHYFDAIISKQYDWLVAEFLETQPVQFLYLLASHCAGVEVIKPYATARHG